MLCEESEGKEKEEGRGEYDRQQEKEGRRKKEEGRRKKEEGRKEGTDRWGNWVIGQHHSL